MFHRPKFCLPHLLVAPLLPTFSISMPAFSWMQLWTAILRQHGNAASKRRQPRRGRAQRQRWEGKQLLIGPWWMSSDMLLFVSVWELCSESEQRFFLDSLTNITISSKSFLLSHGWLDIVDVESAMDHLVQNAEPMRTPRIVPLNPDFFPVVNDCYVNTDDVGRNYLVEVIDRLNINSGISWRSPV